MYQVIDDGGRGGEVSAKVAAHDCIVRAMAVLSGSCYHTVAEWAAVSLGRRSLESPMPKRPFRSWLGASGAARLSEKGWTLRELAERAHGRAYLVRIKAHWFPMIAGVIVDTERGFATLSPTSTISEAWQVAIGYALGVRHLRQVGPEEALMRRLARAWRRCLPLEPFGWCSRHRSRLSYRSALIARVRFKCWP